MDPQGRTTGICVQIGLLRTAEYLYLVDPKYSVASEQPVDIPKTLEFDTWQYYGIDADPCSIAKMVAEYHECSPNANWILAFINEGRPVSLKHHNTFWVPYEQRQNNCYVPSMSLDFLIKALELPKIDVLAVDIEGMESPMLKSYSWHVKPAFIAVETHFERHEEVVPVITAQGYRNTLSMPTNFDKKEQKFLTRELKFVRL